MPSASACAHSPEGGSPCDPHCVPNPVQNVCVRTCLRLCPEAAPYAVCLGKGATQVCYDPYELSCFVGATWSVWAVSGETCVDWCKVVPCPGPVLDGSVSALRGVRDAPALVSGLP